MRGDATWLSVGEYEHMLDEAGFGLLGKRSYYTYRKLTAGHAKKEIRCACENVQRLYELHTPSFEHVWAIFGAEIEKHGLGQCSKVVLMTAEKVTERG